MKTPIWFRLLIVINLLVIAATLVIGYGSSEIAGRVVEARLVEQTARRTGGFLESQDLPFSDTLMQYLRHLHGAHFITTDPAGRQVAGSSLTDGDRWLPAGGLQPSGTIEINGRAYRYESILIPAEPPNRPDAVRLYALIQRSEFELPRRQVAERIYRVMWVVIVAASAVSIGLAWTIARPIHRLSRRMKTLTERPRHAGGSAGSTGHHRGPKEVVQLGQAFDKLMDRLAETRKELARQEQLATLGRVSACVAHELRNPLSGIRMNLHVLREELAQRGIADESVDTGLREIERMSVYLDELMELSAGTADDQQATAAYPIQQQEIEAQALVDSVLDLFRGKLQHRRIGVQADIEQPAVVRGDPGRLRQVLINLLGNAMDATPAGKTIRIEARPESDGQVRFSVSDSGPGVVAGAEEDIFAPFVTTKSRSAGLGLYVCRRIVEAHGGRIGYCNSDHGATFWFTLPAGTSERSGEDREESDG